MGLEQPLPKNCDEHLTLLNALCVQWSLFTLVGGNTSDSCSHLWALAFIQRIAPWNVIFPPICGILPYSCADWYSAKTGGDSIQISGALSLHSSLMATTQLHTFQSPRSSWTLFSFTPWEEGLCVGFPSQVSHLEVAWSHKAGVIIRHA